MSDNIYIRSNRILSKVNQSDILYIESEGNYCVIATPQKKHVVKVTLGSMIDNLDNHLFMRIHRSYIVQLALIEQINTVENEVEIAERKIPLGRSYKDELLSKLKIV